MKRRNVELTVNIAKSRVFVACQLSRRVSLTKIMKKHVHGVKVEKSMMKVENERITFAEMVIMKEFLVMDNATSEDETSIKIKVIRIAPFVVHDSVEFFVRFECALYKCK